MTVCLERLEKFSKDLLATLYFRRQRTTRDFAVMPEADIGKRWPTPLPWPLFRSMLPPRVRARKKDRVAARKFNDLRLRPLRHESLEVRIDHSVLHRNYCVARLLFPSRNCGLRLQCIT